MTISRLRFDQVLKNHVSFEKKMIERISRLKRCLEVKQSNLLLSKKNMYAHFYFRGSPK
jgi:hypothetical protein